MNPAETFRRYTAKSNELHRRYLDDAAALAAYRRFIRLQLAYFLPLYDDLRDRPGYDAAIDFVVSDLTGPGVADRDRELARVVPVMSRLLPGRALDALALAMQLNARVLEINLDIARGLREQMDTGAPVSEYDYCLASRAAADFAECRELVAMTRRAGESLQHIVRVPMIHTTLKAMRLPARLAGVADLQAFLEKGFVTFVQLDDVPVFLDTLEARMTAVFRRVFEAPEHELAHEPIAVG